MLLTPHVLAGMLFGSFSNSVYMVPFLGLFSYFVLELIPHWDPQNFNKPIIKILRYIDFCIASVAFIVILFLKQTSGNLSSSGIIFDMRYLVGGIFGALPYFIFNLFPLLLTDSNFFTRAKDMHKKFTYNDRSVWGLMIQISICIICIAILFKLVDFPTLQRLQLELL